MAVPLLYGVAKFLDDLGDIGVAGESKSNVDIFRPPFIRRIYLSDMPVVTGTSFCIFCGIVLIRLSCIGKPPLVAVSTSVICSTMRLGDANSLGRGMIGVYRVLYSQYSNGASKYSRSAFGIR